MDTKASVLFVDDEERVVNLLQMMFRGDYEVHTATSGQAALEIVQSRPIDVVVSDQRMPHMLGIELLAEVRKRSPATMRILLTGYSDLAAIIGSVNEGEVFRFVNKPWNKDDIRRIVGDAASLAQATRAEEAKSVADDPAAAAEGANDMPELLLLDDSAGDRQAMAQALGGDWRVHGAGSIAQALKILEQRDIGVVVAEARVGGSDTRELLRILKRHYPAIATVMMTLLADAETVIRLINEAQVYRVGTKPIRTGAFQMIVSAAMKHHLRCRHRPELARRHAVGPCAEPEDASLAASVFRSLSGLRQRVARLMR
jgi:serine/threonine-protein kinase